MRNLEAGSDGHVRGNEGVNDELSFSQFIANLLPQDRARAGAVADADRRAYDRYSH